jgi:hypothetical protein
LSRTASITGSGKKNTSWNSVMVSVLRTASQNAGSRKSASKLPKPIHSLNRNASNGLSPTNGL